MGLFEAQKSQKQQVKKYEKTQLFQRGTNCS